MRWRKSEDGLQGVPLLEAASGAEPEISFGRTRAYALIVNGKPASATLPPDQNRAILSLLFERNIVRFLSVGSHVEAIPLARATLHALDMVFL